MREYITLVESLMDESGAGPARITKHIQSGEPFIMISGMRADLPSVENKRRTRKLKAMLAALPVSFIETFGEYQEVGQDEPSSESSYFILPRTHIDLLSTDDFRNLGIKLMHAFDQDAIVFGDGSTILLIEKDGSQIDLGDIMTFDPARIATLPGFSKIKNRKFSFTDDGPERAAKYASKPDRDRKIA